MPLLFDTSIVVELREGDEAVLQRAIKVRGIPLLSILSVAELEGGAWKAPEGVRARRQKLDALYRTLKILDFGMRDVKAYGGIVEAIGFSRPKIIDRMIAAQAIVAGATLATLNPRDFRNIPGLEVEDWS